MRNETAVINMADQELTDQGVEKYVQPKEVMGAFQEFSLYVFDFFVKLAILFYSFVTGIFAMVMGSANSAKKVAEENPVVAGAVAVGVLAATTALIFTKLNRPAPHFEQNKQKQPSSPRKKNDESDDEVLTSESDDDDDKNKNRNKNKSNNGKKRI